jgi:hypothetical protein
MNGWKGDVREQILIIGVLALAGVAAVYGQWGLVSTVIVGAFALLRGEKKE